MCRLGPDLDLRLDDGGNLPHPSTYVAVATPSFRTSGVHRWRAGQRADLDRYAHRRPAGAGRRRRLRGDGIRPLLVNTVDDPEADEELLALRERTVADCRRSVVVADNPGLVGPGETGVEDLVDVRFVPLVVGST